MISLAERRILVTGGSGFLGGHVLAALATRGGRDVVAPGRKDYDLTIAAAVQRLFEDLRPDLVIHLAAVVGGIGANRATPGRFFYEILLHLERRGHIGSWTDRE